MKYILFILPFLIGCQSQEDIINSGYKKLCSRQPDSMSCIKHDYIGYSPDFQYIISVSNNMYSNFTYTTDMEQYGVNEYWYDGITTRNELYGDCDDISLTFASQLILDGVNPSNIRFVASGIDGKLKHYYVKVKLASGNWFNFYRIDKYTDIMYMQYNNTGVFVK